MKDQQPEQQHYKALILKRVSNSHVAAHNSAQATSPISILTPTAHPQPKPQMTPHPLIWLPTHPLLCFIIMATFFSWMRQIHKRTQTVRRQRHTRQYTYDPDCDKVLTWHNKWYVFPTRKKVHGKWHGIPFTVTTPNNWTKTTTTALPATGGITHLHSTMNHLTAKTEMGMTALKSSLASPDSKQQQQQKQQSRYKWTLQQVKPKQAAIILSRHYRQCKHDGNTQDSHKSMKWQPQARPIIQWTKQHLDSFLALAEVACEWNVEPG